MVVKVQDLVLKPKLYLNRWLKLIKSPIIVHIINYYKKFGYNDFILALGYKGSVIKNYFKKRKIKNYILKSNVLIQGQTH